MTEIAQQPARGALAISGDQDSFTQAQVEALGLQKATRGEALLYLHTCQRTGLDPAARQIYAIWREVWDPEAGAKVPRMTIQTGIDGYRLIADRTGLYAGNEVTGMGPANAHGAPEWVEVTVFKIVAGQPVPFKATAYWDEYAQTKANGEPTAMWRRMPRAQLTKCAESLALRKAFPQDLSGLYTDDEMGQADARHHHAAPPAQAASVRMAGPDQLRRLGDAAAAAGLTDPADVRDAVIGIIGRDIATAADLTADEADTAAAAIEATLTGEG